MLQSSLISKRDLPINSQDPCRLSKKSFVVREKTASLSQDALDAINQIFETEAFRRKKAPIIRGHKPYIQGDNIKSFFRTRPTDKYIFRDILEALMTAGLVSLEQGTLEDMLDIPATSNGPYVLCEDSFVIQKIRRVSLSGDAARRIRDTLTEKGLSNVEIARKLSVHSDTIGRTLNAQPPGKNTLNHILQYFISIGVVCFKKGQTLESLLAKKDEELIKDFQDPCRLSKESFVVGEKTASLSQDALDAINQIFETKAFRGKKALIIKTHKLYTPDYVIKSFFKKRPTNKCIFRDILEALMAAGVVCLQKGQTLESLLAKKPEPSYDVPPAAMDTTQGCMGSSGQSLPAAQALAAAVQQSPRVG